MANYKSRYTGEEIDAGIAKANTALQEHQDLSGKQDKLVSGTNIKTINGNSILGEGNLVIEGGGEGLSSVAHDDTLSGAGTSSNPLKLPETEDVTFAICDLNGNSVFVIDNDGNADFKLSEQLKTKIKNIDEHTLSLEADVYMIPCVGQSLAINTGAGNSTFSSVEPLSYDVNLDNANLQDMNSGFCEAFRIASSHYNVQLPSNFKLITCVVGIGGTSINSFGRNGTLYNRVISAITTAKTACDNAGLTLAVPGFMWTQGEEDMRCGGTPSNYGVGDWNPFDYHMKLKDMIDGYNVDIKAITGQTMDVQCFSYQTGSHNAYRRYPRIAMEQEKLAETDERMLLAKTMYDVNYNSDEVHAPAGTYRNMGNMYGLACFKANVLNETYKWVHPTKFLLENNILYIDFETPVGPLMFDTTLVNNLDDGNYGFNIYDITNELSNSSSETAISEATTKITNIELVGSSKVKITMSRKPVQGERLTYGVNGQGWQNITGYKVYNVEGKSGHVYGARGCLRDSSEIKNNNEGTTLPYLCNWCVIFEYEFGGEE